VKTKLLTTIALLLAGSQAVATTISLDFATLPSAQGWQFVGNGISEASAFTTDGTTLRQDTIGSGYSGYAYYQIPGIVDVTKGYSIDVRARVIASEFGSQGQFAFAATATGLYSMVALGLNNLVVIADGPNPVISFDSTSFHDYRLVVAPNKSYSLFVDGNLLNSGAVDTSDLPNLLYFGDSGSGANGRVEITKFVFQQPVPPSVPLPSTLLLLAPGLGALLYGTKRCQKA